MTDKSFVMNLAKLMIAAAWADGELSIEEVNALKDLLFRIPDMSGDDWLELELYMEAPIGPEERDRLLQTVVGAIRSADEKRLVLDMLTKSMEADGEIDQAEAEILARVKEDVEGAPTGLMAHLAQAVRGAVGKRRALAGSTPNREERLDDFIKNRVYFNVVSELESQGQAFDLPETQIRKLCLAAGMMAKVAWVDKEHSQQEKDLIKRSIMEAWGLRAEEAAVVAEISLSSAVKGLDGVRLTRNFFGCTNHEERKAFARCLFQVANSSDNTSFDEINAVQTISVGLKLSRKEFIDAKLTIPREDRGGL